MDSDGSITDQVCAIAHMVGSIGVRAHSGIDRYSRNMVGSIGNR